jgi:tetratricopeptide (TPR) repeat protein
MRPATRSFLALAALAVAPALGLGCRAAAPPATKAVSAPATTETRLRLYEGFGTYTRGITTGSPDAQRWFDQGIQLLYGFNHDEAIRSFRQAATLDPGCAMCWWGVSYAHGLHINNPEMTAEQSQGGSEAAQEALRRLDDETPAEQALVRAVATRYAWPAPEDRTPLDLAYADAMQAAWAAHPDDPDVGALFAESLMNLQPWDLWTHEGEPKGRTLEIVAVLERVMEIAPAHPGANHFYIHAVEASRSPERALPAADRLGSLVPGSGHLVHMPSHIYIRTGQYARAADCNERAIAADEAYFALAPPPRFYGLYFVHNHHFLAYAAMMEGRSEAALRAARDIEEKIPEDFLREYITLADGFMPTTLHVLIRFGRWNDILEYPEQPESRLISRASRHYARSVAFSALGRTGEARRELEKFDAVTAQITDEWLVGNNRANDTLAISRRMAEAEMLYRDGKRERAFELMREAVTLEERLAYDEPPGWMQPVRHALGALLMGDGRVAEAEAVYRADLDRHPNNGWSLLGLQQALLAQGKDAAAQAVSARLAQQWTRADVQPTSSCYCVPGKT